ncbi:thiamine pyrophosphate-dependent enzyme, partial [Rhizobium ruizarguesonis]
SELTNPDFVSLGEIFGIRSFKVTSPGELKDAIDKALSLDEPVLIEFPIEKGSESSPWPFIHPAPHTE